MDLFKYEYKHNHIAYKEYIYKVNTYHYNWHPDLEILVVLKGRIEVCYDRKRTELSKDDVIILPPNCGHATLSLEDDTLAMVLHLSPKFFEGFVPDFFQYTFDIHSDETTKYTYFFTEIRRRMAQLMLRATIGPSSDFDLIKEMQCIKLAIHILSKVNKIKMIRHDVKVADIKANTFVKMMNYIDTHFEHRIELEDIAAIGGYNVSYTSQFFKRQLGITFLEYLTRVRLREAAVRLINTDDRIVTVAADCGFTDVKAFNNSFKKHFHKTPSEYRIAKLALTHHESTRVDNWKEFISSEDSYCLNVLRGYGKESISPPEIYQDNFLVMLTDIECALEGLLQKVKRSKN